MKRFVHGTLQLTLIVAFGLTSTAKQVRAQEEATSDSEPSDDSESAAAAPEAKAPPSKAAPSNASTQKAAPGGQAAAGAKGGPPDLAFQLAAYSTVMATASEIDRCTTRYLELNDGMSGSATIDVEVKANGEIHSAKATTSLGQSRGLTDCLAKVAKSWRFGSRSKDASNIQSAVPVTVKAGVSFSLQKPGEKRAPAAEGQKKPAGVMSFIAPFKGGADAESNE